jgi:hypothetical protein
MARQRSTPPMQSPSAFKSQFHAGGITGVIGPAPEECCPVTFDAVTNVFMTDGSTAGQGFTIPFTPDATTFDVVQNGVYYFVPHHCVAETPPAPVSGQAVDATKGNYWITATVRAALQLSWQLTNAAYDGVDIALHFALARLDATEDVAALFLSPWVKLIRFQGRARSAGFYGPAEYFVTYGDGPLLGSNASVWENTATTAVPSSIKLDRDGGERVGVVLRLQVMGPIGGTRQITVSCPYPGVHQTEQSNGYFVPCIRIDPVCCGTSESGPLPTPSGDTIITKDGIAVTEDGTIIKV